MSALERVAPPPTGIALFGTSDPVQILTHGAAVAKPLADHIIARKLTKRLGGDRDHVLVEGWTTLAGMVGVSTRNESVAPFTDEFGKGGYVAHLSVRTKDGDVIAEGRAICTRSESKWATKDPYALYSMAQTRAAGRAFRTALGWIMELAGFDPTPAEEVDENTYDTDEKRSARATTPSDQPGQPRALTVNQAFAAGVAALSAEDQAELKAAATELGIANGSRAMVAAYGEEARDVSALLVRMRGEIEERDKKLSESAGVDPQAAEDAADSGTGATPAGGNEQEHPAAAPGLPATTDAPDPDHAEAVARFQHGADNGFDDPEPVNPDQTSIFNPSEQTSEHRDPS